MQNAVLKLAALGQDPKAAPPLAGPLPTNTHVHLPPNFSAFDDMDDALNLAREEQIAVLGGSNYYDYSVYASFVEGALKRGIYPVMGAEILSWMDEYAQSGTLINDPGNPGKAYLVAKSLAFLPNPPESARKTLDVIRSRDAERMRRMVDRLEDLFRQNGFPTDLDADKVVERVAERHGVPRKAVVLQERHAAQAFQERLFEQTSPEQRPAILEKTLGANTAKTDPIGVQGDIRTHLMKAGKPAYVAEQFIQYDEAIRLVLKLGGLPCYTAIVDGIKPVTPFERTPETLIDNIEANGIHVTEFIPNRNDVRVLEEYVLKMRAAGLVVCAGTEHNTLDRIPLTPACQNDAPIPERIKSIFWEGACVVVGHQAEVLAGRPGYLGPAGELNPEYKDPEMRIARFKAMGEAAIAMARAGANL